MSNETFLTFAKVEFIGKKQCTSQFCGNNFSTTIFQNGNDAGVIVLAVTSESTTSYFSLSQNDISFNSENKFHINGLYGKKLNLEDHSQVIFIVVIYKTTVILF